MFVISYFILYFVLPYSIIAIPISIIIDLYEKHKKTRTKRKLIKFI